MINLIKQLPKTELHLHIEGTFEPELMCTIAKRNNITLPFKNISEIKKAYNFTNLQSFLAIYYQATNILLHEEDFFDLTWAYLQKMAKQNVKHVEIFFDPQTHVDRNIEFNVVVNGIYRALQKAKKEFDITSHLIACFLRDLPEASALATFEQILDNKDKIIGVGLDSAEVGNPPIKFKHVFKKAKEAGFRTVAHAGEEGPPEYIWQAITLLQVERIDHGITCMQDPQLIKYLSDKQIPLTVCPLSNVKLRVVSNLAQHPIRQMLHENLCVTINSDDPAYVGGYLEENFIETEHAINFTSNEIVQIIKNGWNASFLSDQEKKIMIEKIAL